jgi:hypothetical protein
MNFICKKCQKIYTSDMIAYDVDEYVNREVSNKLAEHGVNNAEGIINFFRNNNENKLGVFSFCFEEYLSMMGLSMTKYPEKNIEKAGSVLRANHLQTNLRLFLGLALDGAADNEINKRDLFNNAEDNIRTGLGQILDLDPKLELWQGNIELIIDKDAEKNAILRQVYISRNGTDKHGSDKKKCRICGYEISKSIGKYQELTIALLASQRVGKTITMASVICSMMNTSLAGFRIDEDKSDDIYMQFWRRTMRFYNAGYSPIKTEIDQSFAPNVTVTMRHTTEDKKSLNISFIDIPGEFMSVQGARDEMHSQYSKLYGKVDCFWFCTDISQLTNHISDSGGYDIGDDTVAAQEHLVDPKILRRNLDNINLRAGDALQKKPTAIIFTKSDDRLTADILVKCIYLAGKPDLDTEERFIDPDHCLKAAPFCGFSKNICRYLANKSPEYVKVLEQHFSQRAYFSTSASGRALKKYEGDLADDKVPPDSPDGPPKPFSPALHMLWTLAVLGHLDCKENKILQGRRLRVPWAAPNPQYITVRRNVRKDTTLMNNISKISAGSIYETEVIEQLQDGENFWENN